MPDKTNFNGRLNGIQAMPETFFVDSNGETKVVLDKAIRICMECIRCGRCKNACPVDAISYGARK